MSDFPAPTTVTFPTGKGSRPIRLHAIFSIDACGSLSLLRLRTPRLALAWLVDIALAAP